VWSVLGYRRLRAHWRSSRRLESIERMFGGRAH
jgi:hypothetical protein